MVTKIISTFLLSLIIYIGNAQTVITTIKGISQGIKNVQLLSAGDTVFCSYTSDNQILGIHIFPDGSSSNFPIDGFKSAGWCGFQTNGDESYHYYIDRPKKGKQVLKTFYREKSTGNRRVLDGEIQIDGEIIGLSSDNGLTIATRLQSSNSINVYRISYFKLRSTVNYVLPELFTKIFTEDFQVVSQATGWMYDANKRNKIYLDGEKFTLIRDTSKATILLTFDSSTEYKTVTIINSPSINGNSCLAGSLLFQLAVDNKGFTVRVFNKSGNLLSEGTLKATDLKEGDYLYGRNNEAMFQSVSIPYVLSEAWRSEVAIIAHQLSDSSYALSIGTFKVVPGTGTFPGGEMISAMVMYAISSASKREQSMSDYMYCTFKDNSVMFNVSSNNIFKQIDDLEFDIQKNKKDIIFKAIAISGTGNAFIATINKKAKLFEILRLPD